MLFLVFIVLSAILGSGIAEKVNRRKFLFYWLVFGILATVPIPFFQSKESLIIFGILAGTSFGLGITSCQAFLADSTIPEERGRVAGLAILTTFVLVILSFLAVLVLRLESTGILLVSIGIRSTGFLSFLLDPIDKQENKAKSWRSILGCRDFRLYLLAYTLFNIAAGLVAFIWQGLPDSPEFEAASTTGNFVRYIGLGFFAIIAGVMADRVGRKKPIMLGLIMLGTAYALIGIMTTSATYFANLVLSGLAWGVIMVIYLVVPGDLSFPGSEERFYAVGWLIPLVLYIGINGAARFVIIVAEIAVFSTILTALLFASAFPIWTASETLPESKIQSRRLKEYTEKVGKIVQETKKTD
ncbi:MAG: MFS transporter [Candidatus Bathyarchaeota archaeon]|nr:MAG: MFS transporter [Candidatus Bathyarchaeota archaeon]